MAHQDPAEFDFVEAGIRMPAAWLARAQEQWQAFLKHSPRYPGHGAIHSTPGPAGVVDVALSASAAVAAATAAPPAGSSGSASAPLFSGRGIVICAGGLKYTIPAWISVQMLRRNGCTLPIELWFFRHELPTEDFTAAFAAQGVTCRAFEDVMGGAVGMLLWGNKNVPYAVKALALLFSRYREV